MTPEEEGFFQAILDHPDDDTPRLVYADWLEERGETERAEFIRVQCALPGHKRTQQIIREEAIRDRNDDDAIFQTILDNPFDEGMGCLNYADWLEARGQAERAAFIREHNALTSKLQTREKDLQGVLEAGWKSEFSYWGLQSGWCRGILNYVRFERDRWITTDNDLAKFVELSDRCLSFGPVSSVEILSNTDLPTDLLHRFFTSPYMRIVPSLGIGAINSEMIEVLEQAVHLRELRKLTVWSNNLRMVDVRRLANCSTLASLTALRFQCDDLGPKVVPIILNAACWKNVTELALPGNSRPVLRLTGGIDFSFSDNNIYPNIGAEGVRAIAAEPNAARLRSLDVSYNDVTDSEARAILASPYLRQLQVLRLGWCKDEEWQSTLSNEIHNSLIARFGKEVTYC